MCVFVSMCVCMRLYVSVRLCMLSSRVPECIRACTCVYVLVRWTSCQQRHFLYLRSPTPAHLRMVVLLKRKRSITRGVDVYGCELVRGPTDQPSKHDGRAPDKLGQSNSSLFVSFTLF